MPYEFTNNWFEQSARANWDQLLPQLQPRRILEIGSFEGASTCYLIDSLAARAPIEIHCIDTWEGGVEHQTGGVAPTDMTAVARRFDHNVGQAISRAGFPVQLHKHRETSRTALARLLVEGLAGCFDFVYVDGSHQAPDVLGDAIGALHLTRRDGVIAFDDYLWAEALPQGVDPIRCPKIAIDAFTTIFCRKIRIISAPLQQLYVQKIAD